MPVLSLHLRDFRSYRSVEVQVGRGLTVVCGPNGAGKTNLLEALYFGCTGRSCRTANDREVLRFGAPAARVVVRSIVLGTPHEFTVGFAPGDGKRMTADGLQVDRLVDVVERPLVSVFLPDRLELVKGVPALRRAHLDQFVSALWPARRAHRRAYGAALAQRNALLSRLRDGRASGSALAAWDGELAKHALVVMRDRREAVEQLVSMFADIAAQLGLDGEPSIAYRPRSRASDIDSFRRELTERFDSDVERGFTGHGPHRDDLLLMREGRELRTFGSQGQQRLGVLALLLAEREVIGRWRDEPPLLLLDDVMSELDAGRRLALVRLLRQTPGQALITTTDPEHVPGAGDADIARVAVTGTGLLQDVSVAA